MEYKTFNDRLVAAIKDELKIYGITLKKARSLNRRDPAIMKTIGGLLSRYPVSFNIDFIIGVLDVAPGHKSIYKEECIMMYHGIEKLA